jgi:4-aminobutyrate aminotransferase-like enzyme
MAVLDVIEAEDLVGNAGRVGAALKAGLKARAGQADFIGDVRGSGLFIGIEMVADKAGKAADRARAVTVVNALKDKGFLTSNAGAAGNVVKIRPPLVFSDANAAEFLAAWDEVIGAF